MKYQQAIKHLKAIDWSMVDACDIIFLTYVVEEQLHYSLEQAIKAYPHSKQLQAIQLYATSLWKFGTYSLKSDTRGQFLNHFIKLHPKLSTWEQDPAVKKAMYGFWGTVQKLSDKHLAITLLSWKKELREMYQQILASRNWKLNELDFFIYYLERCIELDEISSRQKDRPGTVPVHTAARDEFYTAVVDVQKTICT